MTKKSKFYQSHGMLRAKPYEILRKDVIAFAYYDFDIHVIATDKQFGFARDHLCFRKDFAKKTAKVCPTRLLIYVYPIDNLVTLWDFLRAQVQNVKGIPIDWNLSKSIGVDIGIINSTPTS